MERLSRVWNYVDIQADDLGPRDLFANWTNSKPHKELYSFELLDSPTVYKFITGYRKFAIWLGFVYLLFLYFGPKYMKNRPAFNLKFPLAIWNFLLAALSVILLWRSGQDYWRIWATSGHYEAVCLK